MAEICAVCKIPAKQKCSACKLVYYCNREHQKRDWKVHSLSCRAFKLEKNAQVGRHYVATRRIEIGEKLLIETAPLVASPPHETLPVCLSCYALLTAKTARPCGKCGWPLCPSCKEHGSECDFTVKYGKSKVNITEFDYLHPMYKVVGVIKALSLKETNPKAYSRLLRLEDHCDKAAKQIVGYDEPKDVATFVRRFFHVEHVEEKEIARIVGIFRINGHEIPTTETPHVAVFDAASYLEHNCRANCSKTFTIEGGIVIIAAKTIYQGDHISICYTDCLWGVTNRRHHLAETKFFDCVCERCSDPTEYGTMFNAIKCEKGGCSGYMLPPTFLVSGPSFPDYVCNKCQAKKSWVSVETMQEKIGVQMTKIKEDDVAAHKKFIKTHEKVLHENHFYNISVNLALAQMIGQGDRGLPAVPTDLLTEKLAICQKLTEVLNTLVPAHNQVRGLLLFEMYAGMTEYGRRQGPEVQRYILLDSMSSLIQADDLLRHEPAIPSNGKIGRKVERTLKRMDVIMKTLNQNMASPF